MSWSNAVKKSEAAWRNQARAYCGLSPGSRTMVFVAKGFDAPTLCLFNGESTDSLPRVFWAVVVGKSWHVRSVGQLCREVFRQSYSSMHTSFTEHGYVPTLRPHTGRDMHTRRYNATVAELADHLELMGHKVWRGSNR